MLSRLRRWFTPKPDQTRLIDDLRQRVTSLEALVEPATRDIIAVRQENERLLELLRKEKEVSARYRSVCQRARYLIDRACAAELAQADNIRIWRSTAVDLLTRLNHVIDGTPAPEHE